MAQTKDELLTALDNISGPVPSQVLRDIIESLIEYVEAQTLGQELDSRFVNAAGDTVTGDLAHTGTNVGLYSATPVAQATKIADPTGGTPDAEARTAINAIIDALEAVGLTAAV